MRSISRREFLQDSATFAAALTGSAMLGQGLRAEESAKKSKKGDANDTLNVAVIGVRGRGFEHVKSLANRHNCVVTTICDADEAVIGKAMKHVEQVQGKLPKTEQKL